MPIQYELGPKLSSLTKRKHLTPADIVARSGIEQEQYTDIISCKRTPEYLELDKILVSGFGLQSDSPKYLDVCKARVRDVEKQKTDPERRYSLEPSVGTTESCDEERRMVTVLSRKPRTASGSSA